MTSWLPPPVISPASGASTPPPAQKGLSLQATSDDEVSLVAFPPHGLPAPLDPEVQRIVDREEQQRPISLDPPTEEQRLHLGRSIYPHVAEEIEGLLRRIEGACTQHFTMGGGISLTEAKITAYLALTRLGACLCQAQLVLELAGRDSDPRLTGWKSAFQRHCDALSLSHLHSDQ